MAPYWIIIFIAAYFFILFGVGYILSKKSAYGAYFNADRNFSWVLVTIGMIGDSLSGVTFISVPGKVYSEGFQYMQVVLGYVAGYWIIAEVLLPLYYKHQIISVYQWLGIRFNAFAQKAGSVIFIISRLVGASARLYLSVLVFHEFIIKKIFPQHVPFLITALVFIGLITFYTRKGGLKVLVYTDTFQSLVLFIALTGCLVTLACFLHSERLSSLFEGIKNIRLINLHIPEAHFFMKDFFGGMAICIAMTGLDQNMMQKNLSCRSLRDAALNLKAFSLVVLTVNVLFLLLGYGLVKFYQSADSGISNGPAESGSDFYFPNWALNHAPAMGMMLFVFGLCAATFNSADSVLTTLTTSFYVDILKKNIEDEQKVSLRNLIHFGFAILVYVCMALFYFLNDKALIDTVLFLGGVTYGPLLGLYALGILTKKHINGFALLIGITAGMSVSLGLFYYLKANTHFYKMGVDFIIWNATIHFLLFLLLTNKTKSN
ncbi:MAG: sodium:solute symporter [Bacteroidia bacterium]|nr:sodium:solute symporter [Bacteroidia bacterium]